jgi:translation initiation factor 2 subunit 3
MDAAVLIVAANETFPQPQTCEHLAAVDIMELKHLLIIQNKVDLVRQEAAAAQHGAILRYTATTAARNAPIIPVAAQQKYNVEYVLDYIVNAIPVPMRDYAGAPRMTIIRSFDVNKPGHDVRTRQGGVVGGSIHQGVFRVGDEVEIRPGLFDGGRKVYRPLRARITSLMSEENSLEIAVPGGLIGVGTTLNPRLCRSDALAGQVMGRPGTLPKIFREVTVSVSLFPKLFSGSDATAVGSHIAPLQRGDLLKVQIGSRSVTCQVLAAEKGFAKLRLQDPPGACTSTGERIALSRKPGKSWRLIGWGKIVDGKVYEGMD